MGTSPLMAGNGEGIGLVACPQPSRAQLLAPQLLGPLLQQPESSPAPRKGLAALVQCQAASRRSRRQNTVRCFCIAVLKREGTPVELRVNHTEALQELIASREALQKEFDMQLVEQSPRQCRTAE